jgi:hypothetical protein
MLQCNILKGVECVKPYCGSYVCMDIKKILQNNSMGDFPH